MLEGTSHPINFWVGTPDDPQATETKRFENIYNLLTDTWEKLEKNRYYGTCKFFGWF